jgi:lipid-binding SYLF domain-containing protein
VLSAVIALTVSASWGADDKEQTDIEKRIDASATVLNEIMGTPDKAIPDKIMNDAKCIAVIPSMVKIALVFGGNHGRGLPPAVRPMGGARQRRLRLPAVVGACNWAARRLIWS